MRRELQIHVARKGVSRKEKDVERNASRSYHDDEDGYYSSDGDDDDSLPPISNAQFVMQ